MVIGTWEIKMRTSMAKAAFHRKISLLISKLNIELSKKLEHCSVYSKIWTPRKLKWKYLESFVIWCWGRMEKIIWSEKLTTEEVLEFIGERMTFLNNILCWKTNWIEQITEVKGVGRLKDWKRWKQQFITGT